MSNRLFRLADILNNKYGLLKTSGRTPATQVLIPTPPKILEAVKRDLIELYNNFFNDSNRQREGFGAGSKTVLMDALFEIRDLGEPTTKKLFSKMDKMISNINDLDSVALFKAVTGILSLLEVSIKERSVENFVKSPEMMLRNYDERRWRDQLYIGYKNRLASVVDHLKKERRVLSRFVPESMAEKYNPDVPDLPSDNPISPYLANRFLVSPTAKDHYIFRANWHELNSDANVGPRIRRLVRRWESDNNAKDTSLANDILQELNRRRQLDEGERKINVHELSYGEGSGIEPTVPNAPSLFDPRTGPGVEAPTLRSSPEEKDLGEQAVIMKRRQKAEEEGEGSEGSF